jgi:flagellar hook-associated protein 1 FlgK
MPTLTGGIQIALQAVQANSQAIEIIEHNVANATSTGYHRQVAKLTAAVPQSMLGVGSEHLTGAFSTGTGVTLQSVQRFTDDLLNSRYRAAAGEANYWGAQKDMLVHLETVMGESTDSGLSTKLGEFFSAWQSLPSGADDMGLRSNVLDSAQALVDSFHTQAITLNQLRTDQNQVLKGYVDEINAASTQIAQLNTQIANTLSVGGQPNDMLDQRDVLLDRLSELTGATSSAQPDGQVVVNIGGHMLVTGAESIQLQTEADTSVANNGLVKITWADGQDLSAPSGTIPGILKVRDTTIPNQLRSLNEMAQKFADAVNAVHSTGYGLDGTTTGVNFFTNNTGGTTGIDALNIQLNSTMTEETIAASGKINSPGDTSIANQIAKIKTDLKLTFNDENGVPLTTKQTFDEFYTSLVTKLGVETGRATTNASNQSTLFQAFSDQRQSYVGVNTNEEAANLAVYQKAYQAAARVMNVYDELLDTIINGMGQAGR